MWALTAGDLNRWVRIEMPPENLLSCDTARIGKPDLRAYQPLFERLKMEDGARPWFAAAHMWDVSAARRTG